MKFLSLGFKSTPLKIHPTTLSNVLIFDDDFSVFSKQLIQNLTNFPELNMLVFSQQFSEKDILLFDKSIPNKQFCFSGFQFNFDNNEFPYFFNPFISPSGVNQTIWNNILASLFSHTFNSNNSILFPLVFCFL